MLERQQNNGVKFLGFGSALIQYQLNENKLLTESTEQWFAPN